MAQQSVKSKASTLAHSDEHSSEGSLLGPILCWAVVFADIGTSVYYTPGILYGSVKGLAGFFVFLTMTVFVLLTLKYAEVTHRFPQGGGVVTVAAQAMNHWVGALGGMFILVDYFLTAAISCLSGILYFSVVVPAISTQLALWITVGMLVLLGVLNWVGISESAKVSMVGAIVAFLSDIAILITIFTHMSLSQILSLAGDMFTGNHLTPLLLLTGFSGSFLAFSGLESISQLSPVMKTPRKKIAGQALLLVVLTIGLTSPLLTMFSTLLLPNEAATVGTTHDVSTQLISLLGGKWGGIVLQTEVAISASALLVFASNTAIIGAYHVFLALSRMQFFPSFVMKRNKLRGTPHYSIMLATGIPIVVLIAVNGNINLLGDMYAFGLLGAFSLTCLGLDLVRYRERKAIRARNAASHYELYGNGGGNGVTATNVEHREVESALSHNDHRTVNSHALAGVSIHQNENGSATNRRPRITLWKTIDFYLGILTTALVILAWTTNLLTKPLATAFGGSVAALGMGIAFTSYMIHRRRGHAIVMPTGIQGYLPNSVMAVMTYDNLHNDAVIHSALQSADGKPVIFLYVGKPRPASKPHIFEVIDPYLDDQHAKEAFGKAEHLAQKAKIPRRFVYRQDEPGVVSRVWRAVHPHDTVIAAENAPECVDLNPDRVRQELTAEGKVTHLLKTW